MLQRNIYSISIIIFLRENQNMLLKNNSHEA